MDQEDGDESIACVIGSAVGATPAEFQRLAKVRLLDDTLEEPPI
jgi:hypothetical protein